MKNIKKLLAFVAVLALVLTGVIALVACNEPHECGHVCKVDGCGKCLDKDCKDPACADKCPGHEPVVEPHVCGHVCQVAGCGKCLDKTCTDPVCANNRCPGHEPVVEPHVCGHVCQEDGCGKCLDEDCTDPVCANNRCPGHEVVSTAVAKIGTTEYETLAAALTAAQTGDEIVLQKDVKIETTIVVTKEITLNLNEKTISSDNRIWGTKQEGTEQNNWSMISVQDGGKLTVKGNGKVVAKEGGLTQEDASCYAFDVRAEGATLTIENGEFVGNRHCVYVLEGSVTINGGKYSIYASSTNDTMGYKFVLNLQDANGAAEKATISVTGGQFVNYDPAHSASENPEANFVDDGYVSTSATEGDLTVYTVAEGVYTITLVVGDGALAEGEETTVQLVKGVFADGEFLPEPTISKAHWKFDNWYDAETGGKAIVESELKIRKDMTIYARYIRDDGLWSGDGETFIASLIINPGNTAANEYWFGDGKSERLEAGSLTAYIDGKQVKQIWVDNNSTGVKKGVKVDVMNVTDSGAFILYLKDYSKNGTNWVAEFTLAVVAEHGGTQADIEGCDAIVITFGTKTITFYFKVKNGTTSTPVTQADFGKYAFHVWTGGTKQLGEWGATTAKASAEMTGTGDEIPEYWIFRYSTGNATSPNGQTPNIKCLDFVDGAKILVEFDTSKTPLMPTLTVIDGEEEAPETPETDA